jgi:hypothetical protein
MSFCFLKPSFIILSCFSWSRVHSFVYSYVTFFIWWPVLECQECYSKKFPQPIHQQFSPTAFKLHYDGTHKAKIKPFQLAACTCNSVQAFSRKIIIVCF